MLYCYFRSIFVPGNCSFNFLLYIFWNFDMIIYRQCKNWNIKSYFIMTFWQHIVFCPWQIKFCFPVYQWQVMKSPKITKIFEWNSEFNIWIWHWWLWLLLSNFMRIWLFWSLWCFSYSFCFIFKWFVIRTFTMDIINLIFKIIP